MLPVPAICFLKDMVGVFYTWFNLRFMQMEFQDKLMLVGKKIEMQACFCSNTHFELCICIPKREKKFSICGFTPSSTSESRCWARLKPGVGNAMRSPGQEQGTHLLPRRVCAGRKLGCRAARRSQLPTPAPTAVTSQLSQTPTPQDAFP